jgi:hypothetical protein
MRPSGAAPVSGSRWDNRAHIFPVPPRPLPPPVPLQAGSTTSGTALRPVLTGLPINHVLSITDMSCPPPPEWQPFLRDLVISLGYRRATSIWPRLARSRLGNYSEDVRREQEAYMRWCRETIIGFER